MLALASRALCVGTLATVGIIGCAPATSSPTRESLSVVPVTPLTPTSRVIDAARITRSGSQTALDALRAFVPSFRRTEERQMDLPWLTASPASREAARVVVDGHPMPDVESLRTIPARDILAIHILNAPDAMMKYGPSFTTGVVVVQTMASFRRL